MLLIMYIHCLSTDTQVDQYSLAALKFPVRAHVYIQRNYIPFEYELHINMLKKSY